MYNSYKVYVPKKHWRKMSDYKIHTVKWSFLLKNYSLTVRCAEKEIVNPPLRHDCVLYYEI